MKKLLILIFFMACSNTKDENSPKAGAFGCGHPNLIGQYVYSPTPDSLNRYITVKTLGSTQCHIQFFDQLSRCSFTASFTDSDKQNYTTEATFTLNILGTNDHCQELNSSYSCSFVYTGLGDKDILSFHCQLDLLDTEFTKLATPNNSPIF